MKFNPQVEDGNLSDWERHYLDQHDLHLDTPITEQQVEKTNLLPGKKTTLRKSRCTGILAGVEAPSHIKLGSTVRYTPRLCFEWHRENATVQTHTGGVSNGGS